MKKLPTEERKKLYNAVFTYKRSNHHGFTQKEVNKFLNDFNINHKDFNKNLVVRTAIIINGETLTYATDVYHAALAALEHRNLHWTKWD